MSGYERTDANIRSLVVSIAGLFLLLAVSLAAMGWMFSYLAKHDKPGPPRSPVAKERELPPAPRLQTAAGGNLTEVRAVEAEILSSYGWVDKKANVVRIPIDRAIDLAAERGLPYRQPLAQGRK
jgi:hypothetical protein